MATPTKTRLHRSRQWMGLLGLGAAAGWWLLSNPLFWWRLTIAAPHVWAWNRLATILGIELVLCSGLASVLYRLRALSGWWARSCCALGLAMIYGSMVTRQLDDDSSVATAIILYCLCVGLALSFLATERGVGRPMRQGNLDASAAVPVEASEGLRLKLGACSLVIGWVVPFLMSGPAKLLSPLALAAAAGMAISAYRNASAKWLLGLAMGSLAWEAIILAAFVYMAHNLALCGWWR